jgi:hypothetical protein
MKNVLSLIKSLNRGQIKEKFRVFSWINKSLDKIRNRPIPIEVIT